MTDWTTEELEKFYKQNVGKALISGLDAYGLARGIPWDHLKMKTTVMRDMLRDFRDVWPDEWKQALTSMDDEKPAI